MGVIGVDISKYEVNATFDSSGKLIRVLDWWKPEKATEKIDFVIQRSSYGGRKDEFVDLLWEETKKVPIRGFYHYFSSGINWKAQADNMLSVLQGKDFHFIAIDYEKYYNNLNGTTFAELFEIVRYIKNATGKKTLVYFNYDVYMTKMKPYNADVIINNHDIWFAWYPISLNIPPRNAPILPSGINKWNFWQMGGGDVLGTCGYFAGSKYGSWRRGIDLNMYNGTLEELKSWLGISETIPPPTEPPIEPPITPPPVVISDVGWYMPIPNPGNTTGNLSIIPAIRQGYLQPDESKREFNMLPLSTLNSTAGLIDDSSTDTAEETDVNGAVSSLASVKTRTLWTKFIADLNGNDAKVLEKYEARDYCPTKGYAASGRLIQIPLAFGNNPVYVSETTIGRDGKRYGLVKGIPYTATPPTNVNEYKYNRPDVVHRLWQVDSKGKMSVVSGAAQRMKCPLIGNMYIPMDKLQKITFPKTVKVTLANGINVREGTSVLSNKKGFLKQNDVVEIESLHTGVNGYWGKIYSGVYKGFYICLRYISSTTPLHEGNYTDWKI